MQRLFVLGAGGMLGKRVVAAANARDIEVYGLTHNNFDVTEYSLRARYDIGAEDAVINCAGVLKGDDYRRMILVNSLAPWMLAEQCIAAKTRFIHISTDCVFSGGGNDSWNKELKFYRENDQPRPDGTLYSRSKILGEPHGPGVTVIRTSFAGPEHGLWRWLADLPHNAPVEGWQNAWWSGSTAEVVADKIVELVTGYQHLAPIIHIASSVTISKMKAVQLLVQHIGRGDLAIMPGGPRIDRSLSASRHCDVLPFAEALEKLRG